MNTLAWLDGSFSLRFVQTLLHFLWQGALVALVAFAAERFIRRGSAQAKYLVHVVAMLTMACCLPITFALVETPPEARRSSPREAEAALHDGLVEPARLERLLDERPEKPMEHRGDAFVAVSNVSAARDEVGARSSIAAPSADAKTASPARESQPASPERSTPRWSVWLSGVAPYVTIAYLVCVLALFARLAAGVRGGQKLRAAAVPVIDADLLAAVARQAKRIGLRVAPVVAYCERISVPVVVGIVRPAILLPAALASGLPLDQLEALLAHELAHLRRCDPLVNLLQRLAETLLFFHPAVWYVSRRIQVERENASDDLVLASGWQRVHYADALVRMAELAAELRGGDAGWRSAALAASGRSPSEFKRRILRLLDPQPAHYRLTNTGLIAVLALAVTALATPLAVRAWARQPSDAANTAAEKSPTSAAEQLGRRIADFRLKDFLGAEHSLNDVADREVVVVVFLGAECPLAKQYAPSLQSLWQKYQARGVAVIGINSNQQDTPTELGHYARQHGISFPLLKDPGNRIADQFHAQRTPEAFVLDRDRTVRYWGRIDDQFGVGYARHEPTRHYLADAIDDLLTDRPVRVSQVEPAGCHIGRVSRAAPSGEITYTKDISRIVQRRCVECHREGGIAPFGLEAYDDVAAWAETIREVVEDNRMPPWHANPKYGRFANDCRMPDDEKQRLYQWVDNGVPRGDPTDLPPRAEFVDGWAMGPPDLVLKTPQPITVPASGVVDYQYVSVDPGFTEGKWIRASEIRPGVRSVVHHIVVFINPPGGDPILEERGIGFEMVGSYVPGSPPMKLDEGVARYVPPGSTFVFQIHYTPDGAERQDQSQIGLYLADPATVRRTMQTGVAANLDFEIPAGADNFRVEAAHRFSHHMELHSLAPHMHFRGKSFRFEATYPNGSREVLLDVPRYDFNWQNNYKLGEPKSMPEGTILRCIAYFDNSRDNLANPDPGVAVRWGEQTWNEMMIGYFDGVFLNQDLSLPTPQITATGDGKYRARFTYRPDRPAKTVHVAGTFNKWSNSSHALTDPDGDGVYTGEVIFEPGKYRYKFVIDGNYWTHDPASRILTGFLHESFFVAGAGDSAAGR
ncbi:MAG TPA: M56 family metallopeptidase [Pirellulales bacterium]|nr:M56 family metallopeptidase [Pirellulales bacterium]